MRVNVSIPTDSEAVRQVFEPKAPPLERRWQALAEIKAVGIPVGVCVTPMLPLENPAAFVRRLVDFLPDVLVAQDFHDSQGAFGADTSDAARRLRDKLHWSAADYHRCLAQLREHLHVYEAEEGFFPPPDSPAVPACGTPSAAFAKRS